MIGLPETPDFKRFETWPESWRRAIRANVPKHVSLDKVVVTVANLRLDVSPYDSEGNCTYNGAYWWELSILVRPGWSMCGVITEIERSEALLTLGREEIRLQMI